MERYGFREILECGAARLAHTGRPELALQAHLELFTAIENRDEKLAEPHAREHIRQALLARLKQQRSIVAKSRQTPIDSQDEETTI